MTQNFTFPQFLTRFPNDDVCLDEIKKMRFPKGIFCLTCDEVTNHYKLKGRTAYSCKYCRSQVYPLSGTIFEKSTTPLRIWFYAMYLLVQKSGKVSARQLQHELGVTYKTAWRIRNQLYLLMSQNNADLLRTDIDEDDGGRIHTWSFFNKIEITFVHKEEKS